MLLFCFWINSLFILRFASSTQYFTFSIRSSFSRRGLYWALSYEPENEVAKKLYASFGFVENGEMDDDEIVAVLKL